MTVSFNLVDIAVESITSVQSSLDATLVHFTLPAWPTGGSVTVRAFAPGSVARAGLATFAFSDVNQAALGFASPVRGDSAAPTDVSLQINNLGALVTSPSEFTLSSSPTISPPLSLSVVSIEASTPAATTLVLRIGPAPSAVPRTFVIALQLTGEP